MLFYPIQLLPEEDGDGRCHGPQLWQSGNQADEHAPEEMMAMLPIWTIWTFASPVTSFGPSSIGQCSDMSSTLLAGFFSSHLRPLAGALRVVSHTRCAVVRERLLSSGRAGGRHGEVLQATQASAQGVDRI